VIRPALESDDPPEYILLLNADTIVEEHALDALVAFMDDHTKAGIGGSMLIAPDGTVEYSPFPFLGITTELKPRSANGYYFETVAAAGLGNSQAGPPSVCWMGLRCQPDNPASRARQVGLLDEGLYTYFDDPDICLRAARGWLGDMVRASQPSHPFGRRFNRRDW